MKAPIYSDQEFSILYRKAATMQRPHMYRLLLLLSIKLGLRPMEIAGLESHWFRAGELRIPLGHSKRKSGRSLPVDAEVMAAFHTHMEGRQGRVFLNQRGQPFTAKAMSEVFQRLYREAGVEGSCYSGRRSAATRMVERGTNILVVQRFLGHAHPSTTMEYVEVTPSMMRTAMFG